MKNLLSLDIPDTTNSCVIRIADTSIYGEMIPASCLQLDITPPGFTTAYSYTNLTPGFVVNLTACDILLQTANCDTIKNPIVDGVYVVRYSVSPNDKVYVEYNHLRTTAILKKFEKLLCCLDVEACAPQGLLKERLREVQELYTMLKAAKSAVEFCHQPSRGMAIYHYVDGKLDKLLCGCGCQTC